MQKNSKTWIILLSVLLPLLMVGVGFSSYYIYGKTVEAKANGDITAEDFKDKKKSIVVSFHNTSYLYASDGFIDASDHLAKDNGVLSATITFTGFSDQNNANFCFTLSEQESGTTIASITSKPTITSTTSGISASVSENEMSNDKHQLTNTISFQASSSLPSPFEATIQYTLTDANKAKATKLTLEVIEK